MDRTLDTNFTIRPTKPSPLNEGQDGRGLFAVNAALGLSVKGVVCADEPLVLTEKGWAAIPNSENGAHL